MKIAFWSSREKSAVTVNLAAVSFILAYIYGIKVTLYENHKGGVDLAGCFFKKHQESILRERPLYYLGYMEHDCFVERLSAVKGDMWHGVNKVTILEGILYYVCQINVPDKLFELQFNELLSGFIREEAKKNIVIIDTMSHTNISSKIILDESDIVVVNLRQESAYIHDFFDRYSEIVPKAFFIISDCNTGSYHTAVNILKEYDIDKERIACILHCDGYGQAVKNGECVEFLMENIKGNVENFRFIQNLKLAAERLKKIIDEKEVI